VLTPALIGAASVAGRRWGRGVSGWFVGLPLTSGPVAFFLALDHGATFAGGAAVGPLAGAIAEAAFALVHGRLAPRGSWPLALALSLMPRRSATRVAAPLRRWDLPARMAVTTGLVLLLTGFAPVLGPRLAGLLAAFPLYAAILAVFAHRLEGGAPAVEVLR